MSKQDNKNIKDIDITKDIKKINYQFFQNIDKNPINLSDKKI